MEEHIYNKKTLNDSILYDIPYNRYGRASINYIKEYYYSIDIDNMDQGLNVRI